MNQYFGVLFAVGVKSRSFKMSESIALGNVGVITMPDDAVKLPLSVSILREVMRRSSAVA